jgi:hypothetical protein
VLTAVGGGSGNTKLKTRYSISYSSWSSSPNSDGYYTYSLPLSPTIDTSVSPDVLIAGSSNTSQPTDTNKTMFGYVERCYLSGSTLTLYVKTKPTSDFYIWVEGVAGSGSGSIVGNVIQPNGASGGGTSFNIKFYKSDFSTNRTTFKLMTAEQESAMRNAIMTIMTSSIYRPNGSGFRIRNICDAICVPNAFTSIANVNIQGIYSSANTMATGISALNIQLADDFIVQVGITEDYYNDMASNDYLEFDFACM